MPSQSQARRSSSTGCFFTCTCLSYVLSCRPILWELHSVLPDQFDLIDVLCVSLMKSPVKRRVDFAAALFIVSLTQSLSRTPYIDGLQWSLLSPNGLIFWLHFKLLPLNIAMGTMQKVCDRNHVRNKSLAISKALEIIIALDILLRIDGEATIKFAFDFLYFHSRTHYYLRSACELRIL